MPNTIPFIKYYIALIQEAAYRFAGFLGHFINLEQKAFEFNGNDVTLRAALSHPIGFWAMIGITLVLLAIIPWPGRANKSRRIIAQTIQEQLAWADAEVESTKTPFQNDVYAMIKYSARDGDYKGRIHAGGLKKGDTFRMAYSKANPSLAMPEREYTSALRFSGLHTLIAGIGYMAFGSYVISGIMLFICL